MVVCFVRLSEVLLQNTAVNRTQFLLFSTSSNLQPPESFSHSSVQKIKFPCLLNNGPSWYTPWKAVNPRVGCFGPFFAPTKHASPALYKKRERESKQQQYQVCGKAIGHWPCECAETLKAPRLMNDELNKRYSFPGWHFGFRQFLARAHECSAGRT